MGVSLALAHCREEEVNTVVSSRDTRTPLHLAAALGHLAIAQILIWVCSIGSVVLCYGTVPCVVVDPNPLKFWVRILNLDPNFEKMLNTVSEVNNLCKKSLKLRIL